MDVYCQVKVGNDFSWKSIVSKNGGKNPSFYDVSWSFELMDANNRDPYIDFKLYDVESGFSNDGDQMIGSGTHELG